MKKISRIVIGTTIARRFAERFWLSYSPAQLRRVAGRQLDLGVSTVLIASSTAPPRSRPRTLYLMAT